MKHPSLSPRAIHLSGFRKSYSSIFLIVPLVIVFNAFGSGFRSMRDYKDMLLGSAVLIVTVIGLSFVMIGGGLDLSIGYQISIVSVVISLLSMEQLPDWVVILGALTTGLVCGLVNGFLIGYLELTPFAVTIATQILFRGLSFAVSRGRMVSFIAESVRNIVRAHFLGIRIDIWLVFFSTLALWMLLHCTYAGKYLRAIGLDEEAAARANVPVKLVKCMSYSLASVFYAVAAMILVSRKGYAGSEIGIGMEITATVAAFVGGIMTMAERQSVVTLLLGALVIAVIENGLGGVGINSYLQYIMTGIILIVSLALHRRKKRAAKR